MKTKTEKELEREIEFFGGKDFIEKQKGMIVEEIIDDDGLFTAWIKMLRLEGYRLAKEEFNKKVKELKKKKFCYKDHDCRIFECEYAIKVDDLDKIFSNHSPQNKNTQHHSFAE